MGLFDLFQCCGPRKRDDGDKASLAESASLLPPPRDPSILSTEPQPHPAPSYGSTDPPPSTLTGEQRARIEEIGRQHGSHMLPINALSHRNSPSLSRTLDPSTTSSASSSRPSSPSPLRPGDVLRTPEASEHGLEDERVAEGGDEDGVEVVRKSVFGGGLGLGPGGGGGGRKVSGRGRGRGRGRGKGK